jgi:hypothetical protein
MFNLQGKKNYEILFMNGGTSQKGTPYSFITVEAPVEGNAKYGEKLKINVWGADLSARFKAGDFIKIVGATEVGIVKRKDKNSDKWYENLTITCEPEDILLGVGEKKEDNIPAGFTPLDDVDSDNLPF